MNPCTVLLSQGEQQAPAHPAGISLCRGAIALSRKGLCQQSAVAWRCFRALGRRVLLHFLGGHTSCCLTLVLGAASDPCCLTAHLVLHGLSRQCSAGRRPVSSTTLFPSLQLACREALPGG